MIVLKHYYVNTTKEVDFLSIIHDVRYAIRDANAKDGLVTVIVPDSSAALTIIEPIPAVIEELKIAFEIFAGEGATATDRRKVTIDISPRVQAAMLGRSLSIPLKDGKLIIDPYEEIYLIDFDKTGKRRQFCVQVMVEDAPAKPAGQPPKTAPAKK